MKVGEWLTVHGLVNRPDLNGMLAKVIEDVDANRRVGVNINGKEFKLKMANLLANTSLLGTFDPHPTRLDLSGAICNYGMKCAVVVHSGEIIQLDGVIKTRSIIFNDPHAVVYNLERTFGRSVLPSNEGYLGGMKCDLRDMSKLSAAKRRRIILAANIEDSCGSLGTSETEKEAKPWFLALSELVRSYMKSVNDEETEAYLRILCDMMRKSMGKNEFGKDDVERVANYFADGCIPKYYYGLMRVLMIKPRVNDLLKCELLPSSIGGVGGLGCFLRAGCSAKSGELLTLYPCLMLGKHYSKELEGDVERDHFVMAQMQDSPEWQELAASNVSQLIKQAKRYSVQLSPAPGCALFASHPPAKMNDFDPAWLGHMVNSTKNGNPVANCTLVANLLGGCWWGVAATTDVAAGTELVVDYGSGWFEAHPDFA